MKLINTDGMALIGPGSEWFWTAVSGLILAITFIAIYRQLRLQASAGAIDQIAAFNDAWRTEEMARSRLEALSALHSGVDPAALPSHALNLVGNFWERVGYLVRAGHVGRTLVFEYFANDIQIWYSITRPSTDKLRALYNEPLIGEHFEWLAREISAMAARRSHALDTADPEFMARVLPDLIEANRGAIKAAEDSRAITIRPPSAARRVA